MKTPNLHPQSAEAILRDAEKSGSGLECKLIRLADANGMKASGIAQLPDLLTKSNIVPELITPDVVRRAGSIERLIAEAAENRIRAFNGESSIAKSADDDKITDGRAKAHPTAKPKRAERFNTHAGEGQMFSKAKVQALLVKMGFKKAADWDDEKLNDTVAKIPALIADEMPDGLDKGELRLLKKLAALDGEAPEFSEEGAAEEAEAPAGKKAAKKKKVKVAAGVADDDEPEDDEPEEDDGEDESDDDSDSETDDEEADESEDEETDSEDEEEDEPEEDEETDSAAKEKPAKKKAGKKKATKVAEKSKGDKAASKAVAKHETNGHAKKASKTPGKAAGKTGKVEAKASKKVKAEADDAEEKPTKKVKKSKKVSDNPNKMSLSTAALKVLAAKPGKPMSMSEILEAIEKKDLWHTQNGKTPDSSLRSVIYHDIGKNGKKSKFKKVGDNQYVAR